VETKDMAVEAGKLALEKKANDVVILHLSGLTDIADYFLITGGSSERHVKTISDAIEMGMKAKDIRPLSIEGYDDGRWVIMDYGHTIVHVFLDELRELYDLESLWIEAKRQTLE
jgi:ribosome-associated protein